MADQQQHGVPQHAPTQQPSNQFVNFDQFVMQHNLSRGHANNNFSVPPPPIPLAVAPSMQNAYEYHPNAPTISGSSRSLMEEIIRNSNLTPTASEFVPMQTYYSQSISEQPYGGGGNIDAVPHDVQQHTVPMPAPVDTQLAQTLHATHIGQQQGAIRKNNFGSAPSRPPDGNNYQRRSNNNWYNGGLDGSRSSGDAGRSSGDGGRSSNGSGARPDYKRNGSGGGQYENRRHNGSGRTASQQNDHYNSSRNGYYNNNRNYVDDMSSDYRQPSNLSFSKMEKRKQQPDFKSNHDYKSNQDYRLSQDVRSNQDYRTSQDYRLNQDFKLNHDLKSHRSSFNNNNNNSIDSGQRNDDGDCSQRDKLIREIDVGRLECLVCCESIKTFQPCWSCTNCFHIMHLNCVIKWANSSKSEAGWRCPACQHITEKTPHEYYCFCGKMKNPPYTRNDVAHSCGELCGKKDTCEHPCRMLCHPGPCPTCHASVTRSCGCGRSSKTMQCCQKEEINCVEVCDKLLNCAQHRCTDICHGDKCTECVVSVRHRCYCGKDHKEVVCTAETNAEKQYSCGKICGGQLACGRHKCKNVCHADECGDCVLLPDTITSCPCGKTPIVQGQRKTCSDAIPLCQSVCGKPLKCGQPNAPHQCQSKCHLGACPPCNKETAVKCRCGQMEQMVKCKNLLTRADDARCKKRCTKKRNCGKHKCNQECCIDFDHICPQPCNFNLSCGKHKCDQTCHKGRCQPCYRSSFDELYCECRANVIYPPVPCGSKKPACDRPCSRSHPCDHPVQHNCHSATACPPCMAFTTIYCHGKHEQRKTIPCSQGEFSCGLKCNRPLKCGQHKCIKTCHGGACETDKDICKQQCTKPRHMCAHMCNAPCHAGLCPDTACREQVEVLCQCGNRKQIRTCQDFSTEYRRIASAKFASTMEDMQRGNAIELADVLGPVKLNNNKTLDCNEECKILERNRKLAIGLQIRNPELSSKLQPKYSEFIKGWARKDLTLVTMIHDKLTELVKLAKQSQQRSRSHSFPTMNREKRQLVHEMCAMFGVKSVAYDAEPNRNVVANATKETSWLPSMSILEVLKRENGQRRIPVPSNNAWGFKG